MFSKVVADESEALMVIVESGFAQALITTSDSAPAASSAKPMQMATKARRRSEMCMTDACKLRMENLLRKEGCCEIAEVDVSGRALEIARVGMIYVPVPALARC